MNFLSVVFFIIKLSNSSNLIEKGISIIEEISREEVKNEIITWLKVIIPSEPDPIKFMVADCVSECADHQLSILVDCLSNEFEFQNRCWEQCSSFRKKYYNSEEENQIYFPFRIAISRLYNDLVQNNFVLMKVIDDLSRKENEKLIYFQDSINELKVFCENIDKNTFSGQNIPHNLTKTVPKSDCLFRENEIDDLKLKLSSNQKLVLASGFGGVGKTALAKHIYHEIHKNYSYVGWVTYQGSLKNSLEVDFSWPDTANSDSKYKEIYKFLQENPAEKFLIIDNVTIANEHDSLLDELTGMDHLTVLLTSRQRSVGKYSTYDVGFLDKDSSVELFIYFYKATGKKFIENDKKIVEAIVELVKCHTLSIEILAKSAQFEKSLGEYLSRLRKEGFSYPKLRVSTDYDVESHSMAEYMKCLFNLNQRSASEMHILYTIALMPSIEIPLSVKEWINCDENDLKCLCDSGWLSANENTTSFYMHPLVKETILLDKKNGTFPKEIGDDFTKYISKGRYFEDSETYQTIFPKLEIADSVLSMMTNRDTIEYALACRLVATQLRNFGRYKKSDDYFNKALAIMEHKGLNENTDTAKIYDEFAVLYRVTGKYEVALEHHKKALSIFVKNGNLENSDVATVYNNLGIIFQDLTKYDKAEIYYRKALNIREKIFGHYSFATAGSYNNLGLLFQLDKKFADAETHSLEALKIKKEVLGKEHESTAGSYNNLGELYLAKGEFDKAAYFYSKALDIREKIYGANHRDTAIVYHNIGTLLYEQKKYSESIEWLNKALNVWLIALGEDHPYVDLAKKYLQLAQNNRIA